MKEKRIHKQFGTQIASLYLEEEKLDKAVETEHWIIRKAYHIGFAVSNSRRVNNDWFKGKKRGCVLDLKSTGRSGVAPLVFAVSEVARLVESNETVYIEGSDYRRLDCYMKLFERELRRTSYEVECITYEDGYLITRI